MLIPLDRERNAQGPRELPEAMMEFEGHPARFAAQPREVDEAFELRPRLERPHGQGADVEVREDHGPGTVVPGSVPAESVPPPPGPERSGDRSSSDRSILVRASWAHALVGAPAEDA